MARMRRDEKTGALIFEYDENELRENIGWRLLNLEKRVERLEKELEELKKKGS